MVRELSGLDVWLKEHTDCVLCFSGGLDSTALLCNCMDYIPGGFKAVFAELPMTTGRQKETALRTASELGCELHVIKISFEEMKDVMPNGPDRCYHCKKVIYSRIREFAEGNKCRYVLCGDNHDDLSSDRPGRRAGAEYGILAPLEILGIGRKDIEDHVSERGFELTKDTCMATRFVQGVPLDEMMFRFAENCESEIRRISGVHQIRARFKGKDVILQTSEDEMLILRSQIDNIADALIDLGAEKVTLSEEPYRTV